MNDQQQLADYLKYGIGTLKDDTVTLLTLYAASLAFLAAFSDKVLNITAAPAKVRGKVNVGLNLLGFAIAFVLAAMVFAQSMLNQLYLWSPSKTAITAAIASIGEVRARNSCEMFLIFSGIAYVATLFMILWGSIQTAKLHWEEENLSKAEATISAAPTTLSKSLAPEPISNSVNET